MVDLLLVLVVRYWCAQKPKIDSQWLGALHDPRIGAAGAALRYATASHKKTLDHVRALRVDNESDFLQLDAATLANLEVLQSRDPSTKSLSTTRSRQGDSSDTSASVRL